MKLMAIEQTLILKLGVITKPDAQIYLPDLVAAVHSEFHFAQVPEAASEKLESLEFDQGKYKDFAIGRLGLYNDGVVVRSQTNSSRLDEFLAYLEKWGKKHFGLEFIPTQSSGTLYQSEILVVPEAEIFKSLKKLTKIEKRLDALALERSGLRLNFKFSGVSAQPTPIQIQGFKPAQFRFEHKTGSDPALNLFYSIAPLPTDDHFNVLQELDELL